MDVDNYRPVFIDHTNECNWFIFCLFRLIVGHDPGKQIRSLSSQMDYVYDIFPYLRKKEWKKGREKNQKKRD
jgi:hypothetical protein